MGQRMENLPRPALAAAVAVVGIALVAIVVMSMAPATVEAQLQGITSAMTTDSSS